MRISAIIISGQFYGGEQWLYIRLKLLASKYNTKVQIITEKTIADNFLDIPNVTIIRLRNRPQSFLLRIFYYLFYQLLVYYYCLKFHTTHLLLTFEGDILISSLLVTITKIKVVFHFIGHGLMLQGIGLDFPEDENNPITKPITRLGKIFRVLLNRVSYVIIGERRIYLLFRQTFTPLIKKKAKILLLPGYPEKLLNNVSFDTKEKMSIIFPHRLIKWKGTDLLLELIPLSIKRENRLKFIIMGDGPEKKAFFALQSKFPQNVKVTGFVKDPIKFYLKSQAVLQFVNITDPQNNVILDAFNARNAVILSEPVVYEDWFKSDMKEAEVFILRGSKEDMVNQLIGIMKNQIKLKQVALNGNKLLKRRHNPIIESKSLFEFLND